MYYSADTPLSAALSLVKVPPAHDTCVLQALAPSAKIIMQAMFLYTFKEYCAHKKQSKYGSYTS